MNYIPVIDDTQFPEGPLAQMEPGLTDSRPPSVASSDNDNEEDIQELWDVLCDILEEQERQFVEQDETALPVVPGPLFDTPVTPVVNGTRTPMSPKSLFQRPFVVPSLVSSPLRASSASPLKPRSRPLSPMQLIIPDLQGEYQPPVSPPLPHTLLPSQRAIAAGRSARTNPPRESPSHRFFASPDQIDDLGLPRTWIHGQVISTLGDYFCYTSRSKPRHQRYDILPTDLFETWNSFMGGNSTSRTNLSSHFKQAASPLECHAWLVPVLLEHHWYLLVLDWKASELLIYDSLATSKIPHQKLVEFGGALVDLITEDFKLEENDWDIVPEFVSGFHCGLTRF